MIVCLRPKIAYAVPNKILSNFTSPIIISISIRRVTAPITTYCYLGTDESHAGTEGIVCVWPTLLAKPRATTRCRYDDVQRRQKLDTE